MRLSDLKWATSYLNSDPALSKYNVFPATVSLWDPNPRTGRKSIHVVLLLEKQLLAYPVELVGHILRIALSLQNHGHADDILIDCKALGPFTYGYQKSTRGTIGAEFMRPIPQEFDAVFVQAVIDNKIEGLRIYWARYFDKERIEDFPELDGIPADELHKKCLVPYRRGFNDDSRFAENPQLDIPKTFEELQRLFPDPYMQSIAEQRGTRTRY
jgi:hypothetical protein